MKNCSLRIKKRIAGSLPALVSQMSNSQNNAAEFTLNRQLKQDTIHIASLELSEILLINDSRYPWVILVPSCPNVSDITDLTSENRTIFTDEINRIASIMKKHYQPDRLNIAMLGNVVPQLHCHIIARFKNDFAWAKPVWGIGEAIAYTKQEQENIILKLQTDLFT